MKKHIPVITAIGAVLCLSGCGADITVTTIPQNAAVQLSEAPVVQTAEAPVQTDAAAAVTDALPAETQTVTAEDPSPAASRIETAEIPAARKKLQYTVEDEAV